MKHKARKPPTTEKFYAITGQRIIMIGAREEAIYWQQRATNEYRKARLEYERSHMRRATLYQLDAARAFEYYWQEMQRIEQ